MEAGGPVGNFAEICEYIKNNYIFFSSRNLNPNVNEDGLEMFFSYSYDAPYSLFDVGFCVQRPLRINVIISRNRHSILLVNVNKRQPEIVWNYLGYKILWISLTTTILRVLLKDRLDRNPSASPFCSDVVVA